MAVHYLLDRNGYLVGVYEGDGTPDNATTIPPVRYEEAQPRFVNGAWVDSRTPQYPVVTPQTFKMFLTSAERIAIKRLVPTDEVIDDWWSIVNDPALTEVDLNLESARDALDYLITLGVLTADRKGEILAGVRK